MNNTRFLGIQNRFCIRAGAICLILAMLFTAVLPPVQIQAATGDFSLDFVAAAPYTYDRATGGGAYNDRTIGNFNDAVESLEGGDFACGDIVTFLTQVTVDDTTSAGTDAPQTLKLSYSFTADTTGQSGVALGEVISVTTNYGEVTNGDDYSGSNPGISGTGLDGGINDDRQGPLLGGGGTTPADLGGGGSEVSNINSSLTGPLFQKGSELLLDFELDGLERDETIVVRIDIKIFCDFGSRPTGNLQGQLDSVELIYINDTVPASGAVPGGAQTIPFKNAGGVQATDWGDAPDTYGTLQSSDGPHHIQTPDLGIGSAWDGENDGIPTTGAVGDDNNATPDDEDGITDPQIRAGDTSVTLPVASRNASTTDPATLRCWIDFDRSGVFDPGESADTTVPANTALSTFNLNFTTSETFTQGAEIYIRCRIAYDAAQIADPTGAAATGEVEDLRVVVDQALPITIGYFLAERDGDSVNFTWQTATETGNAGFNLFAETAGGLVQINDELIPSTVIDSVEPTGYSYTAVTPATAFYIEDVSITGVTDRLGPFVLGTPSGVHTGVNAQSTPMIWLPMIIQ